MAVTPNDPFVVSSSTALGMSEHLLLVLNTIIKNLPESELREVRASLEETANVADDILYNMMISSTFEMLSVNEVSTIPREDITATGVSASRVVDSTQARRKDTSVPNVFVPPSSPPSGKIKKGGLNKNESTARQSIAARDEVPAPSPTRRATPAPTRYPTPEPTLVTANTDGPKIIISSRPNVGIPDYRYHPAFIQPGIPGPYLHPPVEPSGPMPSGYYVVTKGLYVGIFNSWLECSPWVQKVAGSTHVKVRQWHEAANLYNACLATGSCQVLR